VWRARPVRSPDSARTHRSVWLFALQLPDLVFILNILFRTRQLLEPFFEEADLFLVDAGFLQLRQRLPGEVLERGSIELGIFAEVRRRQVQGDAGIALDLRKRLEFRERWNIDIGPSLRAETLVRPRLRY
jgi:hypothetical protein